MVSRVTARPLVRPRFRRWATVAGVCVGLLLAHTVWDYSEASALKSALETWAPDHGASRPRQPTATGRDAAPYYLAAGILARRSPAYVARGIGNDRKALQQDPPSAEVIDRVGATLADEEEVLRLLDRAAELPFTGFGSASTNLFDQLSAKLLASLRALHAAARGDGDAAVRSLITELSLEGSERSPMSTLTLDTWLLNWRSGTVDDIRTVLSRTAPSAAALERLAAALAEADEDTRIARFFERARERVIAAGFRRLGPYDGSFAEAGLFGDGLVEGRPGLFARVVRPLVARDLRGRLQQHAALREAAAAPWPGRLDAILAAEAPARSIRRTLGPLAGLIYPQPDWVDAEPRVQRLQLEIAAVDIALVRAIRVAVAIERYRRDNRGQLPAALTVLAPQYLEDLPVDPFSGGPMGLALTDAGYAVYSVGANGQDDGGTEVGAPPFPATGRYSEARMTGDVGVSIRLARD
jgi:hypothetical protein